MPFNGIEQQKIILFLTVFNIVNIIYNIPDIQPKGVQKIVLVKKLE